MAEAQHSQWHTAMVYTAAYVMWFVGIIASGFAFLVMRSAINQWYVLLPLPANAHKATDRLYIYFIGAFWVFGIFYLEGYLRAGAAEGDLKRRLIKVFLWIGGFLALAVLLYGSITAYVNFIA